MQRKKLLIELVNFETQPEKINEELSKFPWDADEELVLLSSKNLINVLDLYSSHKIKADDVDSWENLIECREDVGMEANNELLIKEIIHELANPDLFVKLSLERAEKLRDKLA